MNFDMQEIQLELGAMHLQMMSVLKQLNAVTKERDDLLKKIDAQKTKSK